MAAMEPMERSVRQLWTPDPWRQRMANFTIEDVLALPEDTRRVELRDGVMIEVPSPTIGHQNIGNLLWMWFWQRAPAEFRPVTALGILVDAKSTLEPDVVLTLADAPDEVHYLTPDQVVIVVEVVSPGTRRRDRLEKPADYAAAGVPYYWRVEQNPVRVHAYELGPDGTYQLAAFSWTSLYYDG